MTAETSVPQSWNPPTLEGIRASGPSFSQMEFSCGDPGPGQQEQTAEQESGEASGTKGSGLGILPGALSGPRCPLSPGACPHHPFTPQDSCIPP